MSQLEMTELVFAALDELNRERPADRALVRSLDTRLGAQAGLDSLELLMFMSLVESAMASQFGVEIVLSDVAGAFRDDGPLNRIGALVDHLQRAREPASKVSTGG